MVVAQKLLKINLLLNASMNKARLIYIPTANPVKNENNLFKKKIKWEHTDLFFCFFIVYSYWFHNQINLQLTIVKQLECEKLKNLNDEKSCIIAKQKFKKKGKWILNSKLHVLFLFQIIEL